MRIKDNLIVRSRIENTDQDQEYGDSTFDTCDYVYLESEEEISYKSKEERQTSATDYAVALGVALWNTKTNFGKCTCFNWLRTAYTEECVDIIHIDGLVNNQYLDYEYGGIAPALQFNLPSDFSERTKTGNISGFKFKIDHVSNGHKILYHTIEIPNLVYPQTKVNDRLAKILERKYIFDELKETGKSYQGKHDFEDQRNYEYEYENKRYVRVDAYMYDSDSKFEDGSTCENDHSIWFEVKPIKWIIRNWDELPTQINPNGNGTATSIKVRSQEALFSGVEFYPNRDNEYCFMWQNSTLRGALNGINVNDITKNGNLDYTAPHGGDFTGKGFIDDINQDLMHEQSNHDYIDPNAIKAQKQVDDVFFKAIKDAGLEHLL